MSFRIRGLSSEPFRPLVELDDVALARVNARRFVVDRNPGFPDRISMRDAEPGETVLLVNHVCHDAATPYRASHAIYIRETDEAPYDAIDEVPPAMRARLLSLRAFDVEGMMLDADIVEGQEVEGLIARLFDNPRIAYIHAHNARRGCYSGLIERE